MTTQGYEPLPAIGQGAYLLMQFDAAGLPGAARKSPALSDVLTDADITGGDLSEVQWVPIGQITRQIDIQLATTEHDVSGPDDDWSLFAPGRNHVSMMSFPVLFNPDLATQSFRNDSGIDIKASLIYAWRNRLIRVWRIFTQSPRSRGSASFDFVAFIKLLLIMIPDNGLMTMNVQLRVTGPVRFSNDRSSNARVIQDWQDHNLITGV